MNRHGAIDLDWAGGSHTFRLGLAEIEELEATVDMSVFLLYAAMNAQVPFARLKHYSETIRLGLTGGGMKPVEARLLVKRYVDERPLAESVALGEVILRAAMERVHAPSLEDDSPGELTAPKSSDSTSAPSTATPS
ncbi:gene transfer agent family protein [Mesorhizobium sp.]|uniref:gene transfer agent family protein n=1 Tax=Mesorhizobium sp. TaxID=1871066 RepID=UPI0025C07AB4|nr:gene transfer agent family protein [Mesorhizobium sp.]